MASSVSSDERGDRLIIHEVVRSSIISDETFQRLLWFSEETEELAIQDSLCTDTRLQFTATNVMCKGLTNARKCPIIHGDWKSMSYFSLWGTLFNQYGARSVWGSLRLAPIMNIN